MNQPMPKDEQTSPDVAREASKLMRHSDPVVRKVAASALNQAPNKKKYICVTAMDFEGLKGSPHVEAGNSIPEGLTDKQIREYLAGGLIREA